MFIFCNNIKELSVFEIENIMAALQAEINNRVPALSNTQLAMAKGLLNDGLKIGLIKQIREWFPEMGLAQAKYAMEAIDREHGPKHES